jgi:hypothetical protein
MVRCVLQYEAEMSYAVCLLVLTNYNKLGNSGTV